MAIDRTLIEIRERSYADVLDLALVVVRNRPWAVGLAALAGSLPFILLNWWLSRDPEFPVVVYGTLLLFQAPWATAPLTVVLGDLMFGQRPTPKGVLVRIVTRLPSLFLYQFVLRALLVATVVLYLIIPGRLAFLNEVILLERGRFRSVIKRCSTLGEARGSDLFGQWVTSVCFGALFIFCFWFGTGAIANALISTELTWDEPGWSDLYGIRLQTGLWLAIQFFTVARFFSYVDQRIRLEGWEVKLRLQAVGRAMEEAGRW
ncbi:MAG: hypothetical protein U0794_08975 [Isosphaeraceae bacterium]